MCEERAQGNGATTVRVMRQRTRARRGAGIPATKYRAADGGCSAREASRFSPKRETNMCAVCPAPEGATRGHGRGHRRAEPSKTRRVAQDCDPTAYMYTPSGRKDALIGRFSRASTVAPTVTAHWKANQHSTENLAIPKPRHARRKCQAWSLPMNSQGAFLARSPPRKRMP
jgi:hypothetical protein